jgi:hypothetical protein
MQYLLLIYHAASDWEDLDESERQEIYQHHGASKHSTDRTFLTDYNDCLLTE